jgi:hypothetical protein
VDIVFGHVHEGVAQTMDAVPDRILTIRCASCFYPGRKSLGSAFITGVIGDDTGHRLPENAVHATRVADSIAGGKGAADLASFFIDKFTEVMPATMATRFDSLQGRDDAIGADAIDPSGV